MPTIHLKPQSPEFLDNNAGAAERFCDMPGCSLHGDFKAPRDRSLSGHYWFCKDHVAEYNKAWDFFSGMSPQEIEEHIIKATVWDRPTRKFSDFDAEEALRRRAERFKFGGEEEAERAKKRKTFHSQETRNTPEFEALALMGLEPPVDLQMIKARYKELAKKYHPDLNRNDPQAEELLKSINMAYTILKLAYEKYGQLEQTA